MKLKVPGIAAPYRSVAELEAAIAQLEEQRAEEVDYWRAQGNEARADRAEDRFDAMIARHREVLESARRREREENDVPESPEVAGEGERRRRRDRDRGGGRRPRRRARPRGLGLRQGASGRVLRETGIAPTTTSATRFVLQVAGMVAGIALLIVLLDAEERGGRRLLSPDTPAGGFIAGLARIVSAIVAPVDPLTGRAVAAPEAAPSRSSGPPRGGRRTPVNRLN